MKKAGVLIVSLLLLASFSMVVSAGLTSYTVENGSSLDDNSAVVSNNDSSDNSASVSANPKDNEKPKPKRLTAEQLRNIFYTKNKLTKTTENEECPNNCTCTGSVVKCTMANGRELTITAGKSGNTIIQVKGENMTTKVVLYKSDGKLYGVFKNNETRVVKMLPDQVKEKIKEKMARQLENENITLDENGTYDYKGEKKARLFFIIPVREKVNAEVDSETGEIVKLGKPWWAFLARDEGNNLVGSSCGTVTSGQNDACCQTKGYDLWDEAKGECVFNAS
jgi:hypothetical protein